MKDWRLSSRFQSIGCELPLAEIYDKVEWPEEDTRIIGVRLVRDEPGDYEV